MVQDTRTAFHIYEKILRKLTEETHRIISYKWTDYAERIVDRLCRENCGNFEP